MLPDDAKERKEYPLYSGLLKYFPDALAEVAHVSFIGNRQHNGDGPLRWAKEKSTDEPDALMRHLVDHGELDTDGVRHSAKVAWRALALLQREIDAERSMPKPAGVPTLAAAQEPLRTFVNPHDVVVPLHRRCADEFTRRAHATTACAKCIEWWHFRGFGL